jgi:hypothetical protein
LTTWRTALVTVAFLATAAFAAVRTLHNMNVPGHPELPAYGLQDFRDAIYYPVISLLEGHNPYDVPQHLATYPVVCKFPLYAPLTLLLHLPFGMLSHAHAQEADLALNLLLVPLLALISLRVAGRVPTLPLTLGLATILLLSRPGQMAIYLGQSSVYLVIATYLALHLGQARPLSAALALAVAFAKPTFGLPTAFLMLVRGDTRAALLGAGLAALVSLIVAVPLVHAAGGVVPFLVSVHDNYASWGQNRFTSIGESVHRVDAYLLAGRLHGRALGTAGDAALTLFVFGLAAAAVWRLARRQDEDKRSLTACIICLAVLTGTYHQTYDALLLTLPALTVTSARWDVVGGALGRRVRWIVLALIAVPMANYVASYGLIERLGLEGWAWTAVTTLGAAAVLACFLLLVAIGQRRKEAPAPTSPAGTGVTVP